MTQKCSHPGSRQDFTGNQPLFVAARVICPAECDVITMECKSRYEASIRSSCLENEERLHKIDELRRKYERDKERLRRAFYGTMMRSRFRSKMFCSTFSPETKVL
jgi:hypothetical protein